MLVWLLAAVSAYLPRVQLWGINHLAFYRTPAREILLLLTALSFLPPVSRRLYSALLKLSHVIKHGGTVTETVLTITAALSLLVFAGMKTSTNLLGDGQLIAQSFEAAWEGNDEVVMRNVKTILTEEEIAPGATLVYYGAAKVAAGLFHRSPVDGLRYINCLLGSIAVFILFIAARRGPFSPELRLWLLVLALFSSSMQLFFGYVENYTPLLFTAFLYVLCALRMLHGRGSVWLVVLFFLLSMFMHVQAFLFLPSLVFLLVWRLAGGRRETVESYAPTLLLALTVVGTVVVGLFTRFKLYFLPAFADEETYGLLSPTHLVDVLNELLMLLPLLPFFLLLAWLGRETGVKPAKKSARQPKKKTAPAAADQGGPAAWFALPNEWRFARLVLVPCLLYLFCFKPEIGMARDWDLFAMTALGLVPLTLLTLNRFFRKFKGITAEQAAVFTVPALVITIVLGSAWFGVNASPDRTTNRFQRILEYDRTHASYAYENLSIFHYDNKNMPKAIEMMEIATDISHNPRQYVRLAMYYEETGRIEDAMNLMRTLLEQRPDYGKARFLLISILEKQQKFEELLSVARAGTVYQSKEAVYWFYLGEMSIKFGNIEEGLAAFEECLKLNPPEVAATRAREQIERFSTPAE